MITSLYRWESHSESIHGVTYMEISPRQISEREKKYVLKRDKRSCRYCGKKNVPFEFDHVYPYSKGGETSIDNVVTSCVSCNRMKYNSVGIWPKPVGYFNNKKTIQINFINVFLLAISLSLVINGFWSVNLLEIAWGNLNLLVGIFILSAVLLKLSLRR